MDMRFETVCIESLAVALPEEVLTSSEIELRLKPLYDRLKLPEGRLELMTGIRERRIWPVGTRPSDASALAGKAALAKSRIPAADIDLFIHGADSLAMQTDSEQLLIAGVSLARSTWAEFGRLTGWSAGSIDRFICHQVGSIHRRKLYETLGLDLAKDFSTFETLGNTGSVALPATLSAAIDAGAIVDGNRVGLLGIGSGLNCLMLGLEW